MIAALTVALFVALVVLAFTRSRASTQIMMVLVALLTICLVFAAMQAHSQDCNAPKCTYPNPHEQICECR